MGICELWERFMRNNLSIALGSENFANEGRQISSSALGAEFLGWEFFSGFENRQQQVGFDHVRWAGGLPVEEGINTDESPDGSREVVFDLTFENIVDWDRNVSNGYSDDPVPREGIREMMQFAVEHNASFAMIAPTVRYIDVAFDDPVSALEQARNDIRVFATRLLNGEFGDLPKEFILEVGTEYYSVATLWREHFSRPGIDIARTAGEVFAAMVDELDKVLRDPALNPTGYDINIAVQLGRSFSRDDDPSRGFDANGDINGGWGEHADNQDFITALQDIGALDAVDSVIFHRYVPNFWGIERGLWTPVGGVTLETVIDQWESAAGRDLGLVGGHLAPAAQGDDDIEFHAPSLTSILQLTTALLANGMDYGTIFGLGFGTDGSLGFRSEVFLGGQLYGMMVESLPGLAVHDGFQNNTSPVDSVWQDGRIVDEFLRVDDSVNSYVFENEDLVVIFLVAKDFAAETLEYSLHFEEAFETVSISRLWDDDNQFLNPRTDERIGHIGQMAHEADVPLSVTGSGSRLDLSFHHDFEVIRVTLDRRVVDAFQGTDGDDLFRINHREDQVFDAGLGNDTVQSSVDFVLRHASAGRDIENLHFVGSDDLTGIGNAADNTLLGNSGNNHLSGVWGDDTVSGEDGNDTLVGEVGDDLLIGGRGFDHLFGGDGHDTLRGGDQADYLSGGSADDVLHGGEGADTLIGGDGADIFVIDPASMSSDIIADFTIGVDRIDVSRWQLEAFSEIIISWIDGQTFVQDAVGSFFFIDNLSRGEGESLSVDNFILNADDEHIGSVENNTLAPSVSPPAASLHPPTPIMPGVAPVLQVGGTEDDLLEGGTGADALAGNTGADTLLGHSGNDRLAGGDGDDLIEGGEGDDNLGGGLGADHLEGQAGNDTIGGGGGNDILFGGNGADVLSGGEGNDLLAGGEGNDRLAGSFGHDTLRGGNGNDRIGGGPGRDILEGGQGNDELGGGEGDDIVTGGAGDDFLAGGGREDLLDGGTGDDTLNGGLGNDRLIGREGADVFIFNEFTAGERDVIVDFQVGEDHLRLAGIEGQGLNGRFLALTIQDTDEGALLRHAGHEILLDDVTAASLSHYDFIFL
ncbi:Alkaline phosphatase [Roseovarius sp. AK1035]|nr:Alkaline phosphatase [Roseovarius sp. AK1035]